MADINAWKQIKDELDKSDTTLVAVSKTKPVVDIKALYDAGQPIFGENYVQELVEKQPQLPADIEWHYIGHLQSNKVKYIAPFVEMIHAVDSFKLLQEINKQAAKNNRTIKVLLQLHIADEETKFGMDDKELIEFMDYYSAQQSDLQNVRICGLMGMASFSDDETQVRSEFQHLNNTFKNIKTTYFLDKGGFEIRSMGMSGDYKLAIEEDSNMVRIGSLLFGSR
ncbi:MAG: YggS family pyridoxal phosphate-dependent enzyme [Sphingobacteriales bacterium]|nr:MAG: YggS family pyridoxal phosphate-dependent enzyme [Sphingobacteriales bacterium]